MISLVCICGDAQRAVTQRMINSVASARQRLVDQVVVGFNGTGETPHFRTARDVELIVLRQTVERTASGSLADFAGARNRALDCATHDWALWLDGDDVMQRTATKPLRTVVRELEAQDIDVGWFPYHYAPDAEEAPQLYSRLFRRGCGARWYDPIHEELLLPGRRPFPAPPFVVEGYEVVHRPVQAEETREARNVEIIERVISEQGPSAKMLMYLARAVEREDPARGLDLYAQAWDFADSPDGAEAHHTYQIAQLAGLCAVGLLSSDIESEDLRDVASSESVLYASRMVELRPDLPDGLWLGVLALAAQGRFDEAATKARKAMVSEMRLLSQGAPRFSPDARLTGAMPKLVTVEVFLRAGDLSSAIAARNLAAMQHRSFVEADRVRLAELDGVIAEAQAAQ